MIELRKQAGICGMGQIHYIFKNSCFLLADGCHVTEADPVEELDRSVRLYNLLRRNGYDRIGQMTATPGMTFYETKGFSMKVLRELLLRLDFLGLRFADWPKGQMVDDYYQNCMAADERRRTAYRAEIEEEIRAERRENARIYAREQRARLKAAKENLSTQGASMN